MLVLVVGPTGAGKDTLIAAARRQLAADARYRFVRRVSTRPAEIKSDEDFEAVDDRVFQQRRDAGAFAACWRRNGFFYGIPTEIALDLQAGLTVVANVARTSVAELAALHPVGVIEITAPPDQLARRLAAKGRDDAVDAARRLARPGALPERLPREIVANDGSIEHGTRRFVAALQRISAGG